MKKLLYVLFSFSIVFLAAVPQSAHAQIVKSERITGNSGVTKTSFTTTDTGYAITQTINADYKSVEVGGTKASGTPAGKIYFQGKTPDGTWVHLDSLAITNTTGLQSKLITVPTNLIYADYRVYILSTGGTWTPVVYTLRRSN